MATDILFFSFGVPRWKTGQAGLFIAPQTVNRKLVSLREGAQQCKQHTASEGLQPSDSQQVRADLAIHSHAPWSLRRRFLSSALLTGDLKSLADLQAFTGWNVGSIFVIALSCVHFLH